MKVLLYTENQKILSKSGLGKAIKHQSASLDKVNIEYTFDVKDEYDIAHINFYGLKSYLFVKMLKKKNVKIVYHAHSTEEDFKNSFIFSNKMSKLFRKWLIKCYSLGDVLITPTEYSKNLLTSYGLKNTIYPISNGVDIYDFKHNQDYRESFRLRYNFSQDDKVIIGIGLYIKRKGIVDFVELAKRMPAYKFVWFGYSPLLFSDKDVRKAVNTKLDNLFFTGYVEQMYIIEALNGCDLFVATTYEETECIPIIEAASTKTKMIVRDIPVFDDWLIDKVNVYKAKNIDEFEISIKRILNGEVADLTDNAYNIALERSVENIGKELTKVYTKVMEESK